MWVLGTSPRPSIRRINDLNAELFLIQETNRIKSHRYYAIEAKLLCENNRIGKRFLKNQNDLGNVRISAEMPDYQ